jgi:hypothetical protein
MAGTATAPTGSAAPNWLAAQNPTQIKNQATKTISAAYAPAYQDLNQQAKTAQGLNDKRSSDNRFYQSWLQTQMDTLQSHADASHASLLGMEQNLQNQQNGLYSGQAQGLVAGANARSGNVSNNADSTAFGSRLQQNQAQNESNLNASSQQATQGIDLANNQVGAAKANDFSYLQANSQKQVADFQTTMQKLTTARDTLSSKQTADTLKEIARLQGVEVAKAQSNRSYAAAAEKLGISLANTNSLITTRAQNAATSQARLGLDMSKAQQAQMNSDRNYQLNVSKFDSATAKDLYQRDHGLGAYKPSKTGAKPALGQASQNSIYNHVATIRGHLTQLITAFHLSPVDAWHAYNTGTFQQNGKAVKVPGWTPADTGLLNAAYNTLDNGTGLSQGDITYLTNLGLTNPQQRLPVQTNTAAGWKT